MTKWDKPSKATPLEDIKNMRDFLLKEAKQPHAVRCALCHGVLEEDEKKDKYLCGFCQRIIKGEKAFIGFSDLEKDQK
jgi:hypothetical protein